MVFRFTYFLLLCLILCLSAITAVATAQLRATFEGHTDHVWDVAFSPDGQSLASASWDRTVRLWSVASEQLLHTLEGHTNETLSVAFSPDGQTLVSSDWDGTIRLWNPQTGTLKRTLTEHSSGVPSVTFSPDGQRLASGSADETIRLWNTTTWQVERTLTGHTGVVDAVAFSPDGGILASGSRDQTVRLWAVEAEQLLHTLRGHTGDVTRMAFSPDGGTLASGGRDGAIRLWNPQTGGHKDTLNVPVGGHNSVAFSLNGTTLAIGNDAGISLWDTNAEQYKVSFAADVGGAISVVFSPDGQMVASSSSDQLVHLWDYPPPAAPFTTIPFDINNIPEPVPPPAAVREFFDLSPFYQQWISVAGFPILASREVNPHALKEAAWVIYQMIGHRRDVLKAVAQERQRLSVLSINESFGDLPEYDLNSPLGFYEAHTRDVAWNGATASEENLFCSDSDYCHSPLIHEFAHTIHGGLNSISTAFDERLKTTYNEAMEKRLWKDTYAASNRDEYWAEAVGSWFHAADVINPVKTRDALKTYDPDLALLIAEIFGDGDWRYTPPGTRMHLAHLKGFNPQDAFRFDGLPLWEIRRLELEQQLRDPNSDGDGKWVNLELYHPSLLPTLIESTTTGDDTSVIWVKLTGGEISFYYVDADGTENWWYTATTKPYSDLPTHAGAIWLIKDHNGQNLAVFRADDKIGRVVISPVLIPKTPSDNMIEDINGDGVVNVLDLILITESFGTAEGDINGDGTTDILDLRLVAQAFSE